MIKKNNSNLFDVPMGSFFGAELCDLIGLYALSKLKSLYDFKEIGLYRDDGLAIIQPKNNQDLENKNKKTARIFKDIGFKITCNYMQLSIHNIIPHKQFI